MSGEQIPDSVREWSGVVGPFDDMTPPPPFTVTDSRTDLCRHDAVGPWGQPGEQQRLCIRCHRWIWDRLWWPGQINASGVR